MVLIPGIRSLSSVLWTRASGDFDDLRARAGKKLSLELEGRGICLVVWRLVIFLGVFFWDSGDFLGFSDDFWQF